MRGYWLAPLLNEFAPFYSNGAPCNVKREFINYLLQYDLIHQVSEGKWARTILGDHVLRQAALLPGAAFPKGYDLPKSEDLESTLGLEYIAPEETYQEQ